MKRLIVTLILLLALAIGVRADLKTWFHGAPPAPSPGPPDAKAAAVSFAGNVTDDKQITGFLKAFAEAMRVHDGKTLKPMLAEAYAIQGLPEELNPVDFFMQA